MPHYDVTDVCILTTATAQKYLSTGTAIRCRRNSSFALFKFLSISPMNKSEYMFMWWRICAIRYLKVNAKWWVT